MVLISFVVHVMVIGISSFAFKKRHPFYVPTSYKVKIITSKVKRKPAAKPPAKKPAVRKKTVPPKKAVSKKVDPMLTKEQIKMIDEKVEHLKSRKRDEEIDELESIIDTSVKEMTEEEVEQERAVEGAVEVEGKGIQAEGIMAKYMSVIAQQIRREWVYPDFMDHNLVTVVAVKIDRVGTIRVLGIEESSGNALFDKSVIRAINKASPVARPPYEMEVGLRFRP
jgi:TonB family protein